MISIKEACTYSKFLDDKIQSLNCLFENANNYMKITEVHNRKKSYAEANDEIIEKNTDRVFNGKIQNIIFLVQKLIQHKLQLSLAIEAAKKNLTLDWQENGKYLTLDAAIEYNIKCRNLANYYIRALLSEKDTETKSIGRDYKINAELNQVPYNYSINTISVVDFDKNIVKDIYKKILKDADNISKLIEEAKLKNIVDFEPQYDLHDSIEDIIMNYEQSIK